MQLYVEFTDKDKRCYTLVLGKDLVIDPMSRKVMLKGEVLSLTKKEFELLFCLARHTPLQLCGYLGFLDLLLGEKFSWCLEVGRLENVMN